MVNRRSSSENTMVRIRYEKDGYLPPKDLKVEIQADGRKQVLDDIGRVEIDGKPIEPDEMDERQPIEYSDVDCSVSSQRKGMSGGTYKCFKIRT